jgi:hypothetical protein
MIGRNNMIVLNRGDTYEFDIIIEDDSSKDGRYYLQDEDAVYFGLMDPKQPFEDALVRKKFTAENQEDDGKIIITLYPEDTLDLLPGTYYYAVKAHLQHNYTHPITGEVVDYVDRVITIVNKTKFFICD